MRDKNQCIISQPTYSNTSQYFSFTMSYEEAERMINQTNPIGNKSNLHGAKIK